MNNTKNMNSIKEEKYLVPVTNIAIAAGELLMQYFQGKYTINSKNDHSPVTEADVAANDYITKELSQLAPDIVVIAEEGEEADKMPVLQEFFWLVDPLDGTRAFVAGEAEFTVNIALIKNSTPLLGVIYAPAQSLLYYGAAGQGAFRVANGAKAQKISVRKPPADGLTVVRSKSHPSAKTSEFLQKLPIKELISGSSSIKFCQIAEGCADIYPRFGRTMEWDTAAGHAILNAAGGRVETAEGKILCYGKNGFENPHFIAYGG